ncbi:hypothetical protein ATEIFO6365_0001044000 [Aspergillus terreus]|uniref:Uncharacterized protein n=1 Tax=Aspergillus terreus TaxID=33178 RepID=A0A5M3YLF3_ASPTE|nr:hypothetical protein ATETN484_0001036100 [Aspergillus terreus]GFF12217.1 hypothetical protein ATEIFO6365_0001044000 [Aspergillus terreus]
MGGSSPPFLYGPPASHSFYGPTDRPFNPKAVTEASWTRPAPKPKPKGPLIDFNRHPDSYCNIPDGKSRWTPMSPRTKAKVFYGRKVQLGFRVLALLGALGSLFCAIVVKNVPAVMVWIIRVAVTVAILHCLYGIYHLCRSPVMRAPGSQASYMLFACVLDLGLIPFYVFSAYLGYMQYANSTYNWSTLLGSQNDLVKKIAQSLFLLSVVNGGLHAISLGISIFLGLIFREISKLPPDLNPLEDNLTARPHKRTKSEIAEKHMSQSTMDSATSDDPLIGPPRKMAFMHTRAQSSEGGSSRFSSDFAGNRQSQTFFPSQTPRSSIPQMPFNQPSDLVDDSMYQIPEEHPDIFTRPTSSIRRGAPVMEPSPTVPSRSLCASPESDNWVAYSSRAASPVDNANQDDTARRDPSSVYSRTNTPASAKGGMMDWVTTGGRGKLTGETINEDRGEYESVPINEYYGHDDDDHYRRQNELYDSIEQDISDNRINIYQDYDDHEERATDLPFNPLGMNPPTPQPFLDENLDHSPTNGRMVLSDIPNLSPTPPVTVPSLEEEKTGRFYGDLQENTGLNTLRRDSGFGEDATGLSRKKSKLVKQKTQKKNSYGVLRQTDDVDIGEGRGPSGQSNGAAIADGDRKGRVVSNSGADISHHLGTGSSLSYGKYIAGLGVGRRRDVSGKLAEEGRGGVNKPAGQSPAPIRAAGWARFAGL